MSFSGDVKREIAEHIGSARHCVIAELSALIQALGKWSVEPVSLAIHAESELAYKKVFTLMQKAFNIKIEADEISSEGAGFTSRIETPSHVYTILSAVGLIHRTAEGWESSEAAEDRITARSCCKRAFVRGTFLGCGSINDPSKTYHMEFVFEQETQANKLQEILKEFEVETHSLTRQRGSRKLNVVYLKDGQQIADVLNIMGSHHALLRFEDIRVVKDVRNQVNRQVNCEAANLDRVVSAAVRQLEDIRYLKDTIGLEELPAGLKEAAMLRLENEDLSLKELAAMMGIGKSGVNHRFRKLMAMAEEIRKTAPNQA